MWPRQTAKTIRQTHRPLYATAQRMSQKKRHALNQPKSETFTHLCDHVHKVHCFVFLQSKYHVGSFQRNREPVDFGPVSVRLCACCDSSDAIRILQWLCCLSSLLRLPKADDPAMAR